MALAKILTRGQITLPRKVREEAKIGPGDALNIHVVGPGHLVIEVLPRLDIEEFFEKYHIDGPIDLTAIRERWQAEAAEQAISEVE
ncbi:MAG: AbrB/MazE/SpoVT family DNA-binding domain-containing protein [Chloroflexota bacterium]